MVGCKLFVVCLAVCIAVNGVAGFSSGPPASSSPELVCRQMAPNPINHNDPLSGSGGFTLEISPAMTEVANGFTYDPNTEYTIRLVGTQTFRGFLVQARMPGNNPGTDVTPMLLGSFTAGAGQGTLDCDLDAGAATNATVAHSGNALNNVNSVQFTWTAPSTAGEVDFYYTVVHMQLMHYDALSARAEGVMFVDPTTQPPTTQPPTQDPNATDPPATTQDAMPTTEQTTEVSETLVVPMRAPEEYGVSVIIPGGCVRSECDLFIGIDTNTGDNGFLDIYMEGTAEGWLAVGFSETDDMFSADVVACNRLNDQVAVIDGWNPAPQARNNERDTIQDTVMHSGGFNNGRITCTVSKRIAPSDSQDLDLSQDLFIIYARRVSTSSTLNSISSLPHGFGDLGMRAVTAGRINIASATGNTGQNTFLAVHQPNLIRAHGILMIIAWPVLAVTAILFATIMKPALPNGEWFQVHRALMLIALGVALVSFILIFVALMGPVTSGGLNLAHMIIGIIATAMQIGNPIIALFRCNPKHKYRWIFNLVHGTLIGIVVQILIGINIPFGLSIFSRQNSTLFRNNGAPLWTLVAWAVFEVCLIIFLYVFLSAYAYHTQDSSCAPSAVQGFMKKENGEKEKEIEMTSGLGDSDKDQDKKPERKPPSKDAPFRWAAIFVYLGVTIPLMLAIIVMIALP